MKSFISFFREDIAPDLAAQNHVEDDTDTDLLKNPALQHGYYDQAMMAAHRMAQQQTQPNDRSYILKYKYDQQDGSKPFIVVHNKALMSQAPNFKDRGYSILGWVSQQDGHVIRTEDGRYVKDQNQ